MSTCAEEFGPDLYNPNTQPMEDTELMRIPSWSDSEKFARFILSACNDKKSETEAVRQLVLTPAQKVAEMTSHFSDYWNGNQEEFGTPYYFMLENEDHQLEAKLLITDLLDSLGDVTSRYLGQRFNADGTGLTITELLLPKDNDRGAIEVSKRYIIDQDNGDAQQISVAISGQRIYQPTPEQF